MNIRDLEYLVALRQHGHFGRAAEACFVSQPTLSAQFKKLEKELGVSILDRTAKGMVFSEAGMAVLERARVILDEAEQIRDIGRHYLDPNAGQLKMGIIPTIGPYLLPHVLGALKTSFPRIHFLFRDMKTDEILSALKEGALDVGILALPLRIDGLDEIQLYEERFLLALSAQHPHAKSTRVDQRWLANEKLLLLEEGHCFGHQALELCSSYGHRSPEHFRGTSLEVLRAMVSLGEGVTPVPELAALSWSQQSSLSLLPFEKPVPTRSVGFIFRHKHLRRPLYESIAKVMTQEMKGVLPPSRRDSVILDVR